MDSKRKRKHNRAVAKACSESNMRVMAKKPFKLPVCYKCNQVIRDSVYMKTEIGSSHLNACPSKRRRGLSAGRERMLKSDAYTQALDDALTAAEGPLTILLKHFEPSEVQDAFTCHLSTHLGSELINIKEHGHRNDDPDDKPAADTKQEFVDRIARMKTEEEFGDNLPESEDWICTLNSLIEKARAINKR